MGKKKWITSEVLWLFITAYKTDKGMSLFLVERGEGLETKVIKTSYSTTAGMPFVTYDNVEVLTKTCWTQSIRAWQLYGQLQPRALVHGLCCDMADTTCDVRVPEMSESKIGVWEEAD